MGRVGEEMNNFIENLERNIVAGELSLFIQKISLSTVDNRASA